MQICPKCSEVHEKPGIFCSRKCANSRIHTSESNQKRSNSQREYFANLTDVEFDQIIAKGLTSAVEVRKSKARQRLQEAETQNLGHDGRRKKVILEQNNKCNGCGLDRWRGRPLVLELEHKDGDKHHNARENLEALCPNCHSLTPTWRGRNKKYSER